MKKILPAHETKLVSGKPYWPIHNGQGPTYPSLQEDIECDVAVIGGGITGALACYELTREGFDTVLLEQNRIASGSTSASTALLSYEYDLLLTHLADRIGEKKAVHCYELCYEAIGRIRLILKAIKQTCAWDAKRSIRVARSESVKKTFEKEERLRNQRGLKLELLDEAELEESFGIVAPFALVSTNAAQIDPYALTKHLVAHSATKGLRTFEQTKATQIESGRTRATIKSRNGYRIVAKRVVFATGYASEKYLPRSVGILNTDYCFVSHPIRKIAKFGKCHMVEHGTDYLYMSTFGNRVMVGMEAKSFHGPMKRGKNMRRNVRSLADCVAEYLPGIRITSEYAWSGTFARSKDSLPYMGELPKMPNVIFLLGYGGNGIAGSAMLAELLPDLIRGKRSKNAALFGYDR